MGAEGGNLTYAESSHAALWNEGIVTRRENGSAEFTPVAGGLGDWGNLYALTSFNDTKNNRRVQIGWAPEDLVGDSGLFSATQQGFQGSHSLPRELFVHEVSGVVNVDGQLTDNRNSLLSENGDGTFTAQTLGVRPLPDVVAGLRGGEGCTHHSYGKSKTYGATTMVKHSSSAQLEVQATVSKAGGAVGLIIGANPSMTEYTTIMYEPSNYTLLVDRSHSSTIKQFNDATITGYFYPYTTVSDDGSTAQESITMDVFVDGSLVEVYLNERFALTTRIYPASDCSTGYGVYVAPGTQVTVESLHAWENLLHVFPERPANSSSPLVFDTAAETNDYVWWAGN